MWIPDKKEIGISGEYPPNLEIVSPETDPLPSTSLHYQKEAVSWHTGAGTMLFALLAPACHFIPLKQPTVILPKVSPFPISSSLNGGPRQNILWGFILPIVFGLIWITWHAHGAQEGCAYECSQTGGVEDTKAVLSCSTQCAPILLFLFNLKKCILPGFLFSLSPSIHQHVH